MRGQKPQEIIQACNSIICFANPKPPFVCFIYLNALFRLVVLIVGIVSLLFRCLCPFLFGLPWLFVCHFASGCQKNGIFAVDINFGFTFTPQLHYCYYLFVFFFFLTLTLPQEEEQTRFGHSQFPEFVYQFIVCLLFLALRDFTLSV